MGAWSAFGLVAVFIYDAGRYPRSGPSVSARGVLSELLPALTGRHILPRRRREHRNHQKTAHIMRFHTAKCYRAYNLARVSRYCLDYIFIFSAFSDTLLSIYTYPAKTLGKTREQLAESATTRVLTWPPLQQPLSTTCFVRSIAITTSIVIHQLLWMASNAVAITKVVWNS
jgi:hypothetical protein